MTRMNRILVRAAIGGALIATAPALALAQTPALPEGTILPGVSIAGVDVSGLAALDARQRLFDQLVTPRRAPMPVTFNGRTFTIDPDAVGYRANVDAAIVLAFQQAPVPGTTADVPLAESISRTKVRDVVAWRGTQYEVDGKDATVILRGLQPIVRKPKLGLKVDVKKSVDVLAPAFVTARPSTPYALVTKRVAPSSTSVGAVVVIDKSTFKLRLYKGVTKPGGHVMARIKTYPVAVGQPAYPTPVGNFQVVDKQVDPTWFPPSSPWAAGLGPIPPGAGNPLGTRWIGTSAPGIGMHGTPNSSSIGSAASHGCIRMYISDVENLYPRVQIGTPVFIRN